MQQILYAAGFNAWGQLQFDTPGNQVGTQAEPDDITAFTCVLEDPEIVHVRPSLSFTTGMMLPLHRLHFALCGFSLSLLPSLRQTVTTSHGILTAGVAPVGDDGGAEGGQYFSEALNGRVVGLDNPPASLSLSFLRLLLRSHVRLTDSPKSSTRPPVPFFNMRPLMTL